MPELDPATRDRLESPGIVPLSILRLDIAAALAAYDAAVAERDAWKYNHDPEGCKFRALYLDCKQWGGEWMERAHKAEAELDAARAALLTIQRCTHDRHAELAGDSTTYEDAFSKLCTAFAALECIDRWALEALGGQAPPWYRELDAARAALAQVRTILTQYRAQHDECTVDEDADVPRCPCDTCDAAVAWLEARHG